MRRDRIKARCGCVCVCVLLRIYEYDEANKRSGLERLVLHDSPKDRAEFDALNVR